MAVIPAKSTLQGISVTEWSDAILTFILKIIVLQYYINKLAHGCGQF